jgi:hypothetical protein
LAAAELAARGMGATDRGVIHQRDLFFEAPHARLKLRAIAGREAAELISIAARIRMMRGFPITCWPR